MKRKKRKKVLIYSALFSERQKHLVEVSLLFTFLLEVWNKMLTNIFIVSLGYLELHNGVVISKKEF
jgi:hypothetical protein